MNPTTQTTDPVPTGCAEDVILTRSTDGMRWQCGPAADDQPLTLQTEDCQYLLGRGDFAHGVWTTYVCAADAPLAAPATTVQQPPALPDTALAPTTLDATLTLGALALAGALATVRRGWRR